MKTIKSIISVGVFIFGITLQNFAQIVLPEITIHAMNYKYLSSVDAKGSTEPVATLERYAAAFDPRESEFYEDEYEDYFISFYIPDGQILGVYDKEGNLKRTVEKYKNVTVPQPVRVAVAKKYPNWIITKDVYLVTYHEKKGVTKRYKLLLENDDQRIRVKINDKGEFL